MSEKKEGKEESEDGKRKEKGGNRKCGRRRRDIIERPLLLPLLLMLPLLLLHEWTAIYVSWEGEEGGGQQEGCNFFWASGARMGCLPIFSSPSGSAHYIVGHNFFSGERRRRREGLLVMFFLILVARLCREISLG